MEAEVKNTSAKNIADSPEYWRGYWDAWLEIKDAAEEAIDQAREMLKHAEGKTNAK